MDNNTKIVMTCVLATFGLTTLAVIIMMWGSVFGFCCRMFRRAPRPSEKKPKTRLPRTLQQALTLLEGVTEKRPHRNPVTESETAECPICLQALYPEEIQAPAAAVVAGNKEDLESGLRATTTATEIESKEKESTEPIEDVALMLKRCRHIFHARCLAGWFLRKKHNCPVCREKYYQVVDQMTPDEDYRASVPPFMPIYAF
ncbi:hypothetical protein F4821DRAFT_275452 [Hypoxylon rubiginosum]|uniref:Uncharacterized protein n=1 Tax=Hypoxylon rubiginosum TaxID=110542 RepID=A0ACC0CKF7_9PEZI|nr:hypothetical protein F4821DRAFT_275452 [Hypoxylon rubiginosum]